MWPHGMNIPFMPTLICSQHTVHVGGSRLESVALDLRRPPGAIIYFLQCFSSILMIGSLFTAPSLALFFFLRCSASYSLSLLTISIMSPSGLKLDSKFVMKSLGSAPLKTYCILRNWWLLKSEWKEDNILFKAPVIRCTCWSISCRSSFEGSFPEA